MQNGSMLNKSDKNPELSGKPHGHFYDRSNQRDHRGFWSAVVSTAPLSHAAFWVASNAAQKTQTSDDSFCRPLGAFDQNKPTRMRVQSERLPAFRLDIPSCSTDCFPLASSLNANDCQCLIISDKIAKYVIDFISDFSGRIAGSRWKERRTTNVICINAERSEGKPALSTVTSGGGRDYFGVAATRAPVMIVPSGSTRLSGHKYPLAFARAQKSLF